ncbi:Sortase (surface protein transpeptidase) [Aerococcus viridans]|uniref:Sortase n=3 Tax=Aerococcus TaxID=1375 RepID=A0AAU8U3A7_9LACT|nr:class A sortase [Aerococcus viridans]AMC00357.1 sortase [Aerococcus viridans]EFG49847.1 sortase family protein [Aerococcus viridans ATCC 11563 = CCUG 4311]SPT61178.1 Sortase (surface protein transpeptidase) [Aerococcus viridans]SUU08994.1 Sortase (surface protein transpeptidase) [Aerococcus viridans]
MRRLGFRRFLGLILLGIGIVIMVHQAWPVVQVYLNQQDVAVANYTAEELQENASDQSNGQFDFNEVRNVSAVEINQVRSDIESGEANLDILGAVAIPNANLNTAVIKGMSDAAMVSGAGTMFPDQVMGQGNYTLASHHIGYGTDILLNNISDSVTVGDKIYLTDLTNVYVYETFFVEAVNPDQVQYISQEMTGDPIVTLMTCTADLTQRWIVQGNLTETVAFGEAPAEVQALFQ